MKLFTSLLLIIFAFNALKLDAAFDSLINISTHQESASSCCKNSGDKELCKLENINEDSEKSEHKGCCDDNDCHCPCCFHVVFYNSDYFVFTQNLNYLFLNHTFSFQYIKDFQYSIFHPPLV